MRRLRLVAVVLAVAMAAIACDAQDTPSATTVGASPTPPATGTGTPPTSPTTTPTLPPRPSATETPTTATSTSTAPATPSPTSGPDVGWTVGLFEVRVTINSDGSLDVREDIAVDFGALEKHGIFREIPVLFDWPADPLKQRRVGAVLTSVTDGAGKPLPVEESTEGRLLRWRIGDPDRTVSGKQNYRIAYTVTGVLTERRGYDELSWDATGSWPVPIDGVSVTVTVVSGAFLPGQCFIGPPGAREACGRAVVDAGTATFEAGRTLAPGEGLRLTIGLPPGLVTVAPPVLE